MKKSAFFLIFASFLFFSCKEGKKYSFFFPKIDEKIEKSSEILTKEERVFVNEPSQGDLRFFVEELVLGPITPRLRPLFSLGTSVEFCFLQNFNGKQTLFVGLSKESLYQMGSATDIQNGISLFRKNIEENFKNIEEILLFIDGLVVNEYQI